MGSLRERRGAWRGGRYPRSHKRRRGRSECRRTHAKAITPRVILPLRGDHGHVSAGDEDMRVRARQEKAASLEREELALGAEEGPERGDHDEAEDALHGRVGLEELLRSLREKPGRQGQGHCRRGPCVRVLGRDRSGSEATTKRRCEMHALRGPGRAPRNRAEGCERRGSVTTRTTLCLCTETKLGGPRPPSANCPQRRST